MDGQKVINLAEVQAFDSDGNLINASGAAMSSVYYNSYYPKANHKASVCVDGNTALSNFCHTKGSDADPWLRIDYKNAAPIAKIIVHNRNGYEGRIVGARISISTDAGGTPIEWESTFYAEQAIYTFYNRTYHYSNVFCTYMPSGCASNVFQRIC